MPTNRPKVKNRLAKGIFCTDGMGLFEVMETNAVKTMLRNCYTLEEEEVRSFQVKEMEHVEPQKDADTLG